MVGKRSRVEKRENGILVGMGLPDHGDEGIEQADGRSEPRDWDKLGGHLGGVEEESSSIWECGEDGHGWSRERHDERDGYLWDTGWPAHVTMRLLPEPAPSLPRFKSLLVHGPYHPSAPVHLSLSVPPPYHALLFSPSRSSLLQALHAHNDQWLDTHAASGTVATMSSRVTVLLAA